MAAHLLGRRLRTCIRQWVPGAAAMAPVLLGLAEAALAFDAAAVVDVSRRDGDGAAKGSHSVLGPMSK